MRKNNAEVLSYEQVDKKNFSLSIINGIAFKAGFEYVNSFTIVSVFIHSLTGSVALAGLSQFIQTFARQFGRLIKSSKIHSIKNQPLYMGKVNIYSRALWIIISLMLLLNVPQNILIPSIFIIMSISWVLCGLTWPVFEDHLVRTILPRRRSELLGYRELLGGAAAFLGTLIIKSVLGSTLSFNEKYAILMFLGSFFLLASAIPLFIMKDPYHKVDKNPMPLFKIIKNTGNIVKKEKDYKWYLIARSIWVITDCALLYSIVATKSIGNLNDIIVSYMIIAQIVGRLVGGMFWGKVAKKQGSRISILIAQGVNVVIAIIMIVVLKMQNISNIFYIAINFIVGISIPAVLVSFIYVSEITPSPKRPKFMVIESAVLLPLSFASYLFGIIAEKFGFISIYVILIV
jgi:hypothetical protein